MSGCKLLPELCEIVTEAGALAMTYHGHPVENWEKSRNNPVSVADLAVDEYLRQGLAKLLPDAALLSEESGWSGRAGGDSVWIVDPIDGTRAFLKGRDDFAVSVALLQNGAPVLGCLYAPARDSLYTAAKGNQARRNGDRIMVSKRKALPGSTLVANDALFAPTAGWMQPWPKLHLKSANSFALRVALVAEGSADATVTLRAKSDWDLAAAHLILSEAGGEILSSNLKVPQYGGGSNAHAPVVAATPGLMSQLVRRLEDLK